MAYFAGFSLTNSKIINYFEIVLEILSNFQNNI